MGTLPEKPGFMEFPINRYEALAEVHRIFEANNVDLDQVFEVLLNSIDGHLVFRFGCVSIVLSRDSESCENTDSICLLIVLENEEIRRDVSFECEARNLGLQEKKDDSRNDAPGANRTT